MILTLIVIWVVLSMVFFGSLAFAASRPMPAVSMEDLHESEISPFAQEAVSEPEFAYAAVATPPQKLSSFSS